MVKPKSLPAQRKYGLSNQGATCYLNSVLQVLFMTEDFREAVERHSCETSGTECIDQHLTSLFGDLKRRKAHTYKITKKLGIDNVYEQRDAAEYFEKILGLTSPEASQIFHGLLTHKTKCSARCAETEAEEAFWHLPLALVDSNSEDYSVVDGIKEYFRASVFSGENQMYCDECDAKSDATIKCVIKRHPEVLMLLLKRFEFDYRYMRYVKINRTVDVPYTLQIPTNQTYELYGVVDHFGDLRGGHYIARIKPQEEETWYKFNDERVTLLDYQPFQVDNIEKFGSAYLLFYRKKTVHAADTCPQDIREESTPGDPPATNDIHDQCQDAVKMREREEVEEAAEVGNNTAVSLYTNEETGITDIVSVGEVSSDFSKEDQDNDSGRRDDVSPNVSIDLKPDVSNKHAIHCHQSSDAQRRVMNVKTVKDGKTGEDEQSEKKKKPMTKYLYRDAEHQDNEGLDNIRQNEDLGGKQEVGQDYGLKSVNDKVGKKDKNGADERGMASHEFQDNRRVGDSKQNMPKDDQGCEQGSSSINKRHEQPREDKRDVKGVKEQKRGDDKYAQMRETSMTKQGVEDQDKRRVDGVEQNRPQQGICVTPSTHKDISVEKQAEEQGNKGDEHIRNRTDFFPRQRLPGSQSVIENREVGSVEKVRQGNSQPKARTGCNEDTVKEICGSVQSKTYQVKIVEEEIKEIPGKTKSKRWRNLPKTFSNLNLSESSLQGPQKHGIKRVITYAQEENATNSTSHSDTEKKQKVSGTQEQAPEMKQAMKKTSTMHNTQLKQNKKEKNNQKRTPGCCPLSCKSQSNAGQSSESD